MRNDKEMTLATCQTESRHAFVTLVDPSSLNKNGVAAKMMGRGALSKTGTSVLNSSSRLEGERKLSAGISRDVVMKGKPTGYVRISQTMTPLTELDKPTTPVSFRYLLKNVK